MSTQLYGEGVLKSAFTIIIFSDESLRLSSYCTDRSNVSA
jgi:hypothetical protein